MSHNHNHVHEVSAANEKRLWFALGLTLSYLTIEIIAGIYTNSLSLLSDAAHMFTDAAALAIALTAVIIARRPADDQRTYGYYRFEILAATFNALLLLVLSVYIIYEAFVRIKSPQQVDVDGMFWVALVGLVVNVIAIMVLAGGEKNSMNVRGAYLEALADLMGSAGVVCGAIAMYFTGWMWVDSLVAIGIGVWVVPRAIILLKDALHILLEGTPENVDLKEIRDDLRKVEGVTDLHDLHVWSLTNDKVTLTAHLVTPERPIQEVLDDATRLLEEKFGIYHATLQVEKQDCALARPEVEHFSDPRRRAAEDEHDHDEGDEHVDNPEAGHDHNHDPAHTHEHGPAHIHPPGSDHRH